MRPRSLLKPEIYAEAFLEIFGVDAGARLDELTFQLGLKIREVEADGFDGALLRVRGRPLGTIALNTRIREPGRRLFTLAHEIGHFLLPGHDIHGNVCHKHDINSWGKKGKKREYEANLFAANVLIPRVMMQQFFSREPEAADIGNIAEACGTSLTASALRYVALSPYRLCLVWIKRGEIVWARPSESFNHRIEPSLADEKYRRLCVPPIVLPTPRIPEFLGVNPQRGLLPEHVVTSNETLLEYVVPMPRYKGILVLLYIHQWRRG